MTNATKTIINITNSAKDMKTIAIIISKHDPAGMNMYSFLKEKVLPENVKIHLVEEKSIFNENLDKQKEYSDTDIFIFATTHTSKSGKPSLCVHAPGNWAIAGLGGKDNELCIAPVYYMRKAFLNVVKAAQGTRYEPIMEVTHHGPYLEKPCFFMEIGSGDEAWNDKDAGARMADAILDTVTGEPPNQETNPEILPAVGVGGLHNVPVLSKYVERGQIALGHVIPKHGLEHFSREKIIQAMNCTMPTAKIVVVDWKGLAEYKDKVRTTLDAMQAEGIIEWKRSDKM